MADSTSNYVIRLVVDNANVRTAVADSAAALTSLGPAVADGISAGARTADTAIQMVDRDAQKLAKTIQDMSATLGMTPVEKLAYRANEMGIGAQVAPDISKLLDYEAAQRGVASSAAVAAAAVNAFGETEEQAAARIKGVADAAVQSQSAMQGVARAAYDAASANQNLAKASSDGGATLAAQNQAIRDYAVLQARQSAQVQELREGLKTGSGSFTELEAQYSRLDAAMAQGSLSAEEYESAFASLRKEEDNLARGLDALRGRYDPIGVAQRRLAQDTKTLEDAFKSGQLSEKEYQAALSGIQVDQARLALASLAAQERDLRQQLRDGTITNKEFKQSIADIGTAKEPLQAIVKNAGSAGEAVHEFGLKTASARREVIVLGHEMLMGNWSNFGGSLMVLAERTDLLTLAMSGTGLAIAGAAGIVAAFAAAAVVGAREQAAMNQALVMSGNYAGTTSDGLRELARSAATSSGAIGTAKDAVTALAGSGRFTASEILTIATAVSDVSDTTGRKIGDIIGEFEKLAEDPVKSIVTLNDKYHFLTRAVYEQIAALDERGNRQAAAELAEQTFSDALSQRATEIRASQGIIEQGYHAIAAAASTAKAIMLSIGQTTPISLQIADLAARRSAAQNADAEGASGGVAGMADPDAAVKNAHWSDADEKHFQDLIKQRAQDLAKANKEADDKAKEQGQINADQWMKGFRGEFATNAQKRAKEKQEYIERATTLNYSPERQAADLALIDAKYKDPKQPKGAQPRDDAATRMLESLRQQESSTEAQLASSDKLTGAAKQLAEFNQRIADIKAKQIQTADDKSLVANQDLIRAQLDRNIASEKSLQLKQQEDQLTQRSAQINQQIADGQATRAENYQRTLGAFGQGKDQLAQVQSMNQIATEFQKYHERLAKETPKDLLGSDKYVAAQASIDAAMQHSLDVASNYYAQLKAKQGDWKNGVTQVMADYQSSVDDHAGQAASALTDGLKQGEDAFAQFATTGKLSVGNLFSFFAEELARMEYRLAISKLFKSDWLTDLLGFSGPIGTAFGTLGTTGASASAATNVVSSGYSSTLFGPTSIGSYPTTFDTGGFTGPGGKYDPAGIVHKGEFVFDKETTSRYRPLFDAIHSGQFKGFRGYAEGGLVGGGGGSGGFGISAPITVINEAGDVVHASAKQTRGANGMPSTEVIVRRVGNELAKQVHGGQGALHGAIASRFGVKPRPGGI